MEESDLIALWWHYESVAMHFNELSIQYRLQVMGGVGAIGTVFGYLKNQGSHSNPAFDSLVRDRRKDYMLGQASILLFSIVFALALLDLKYYHPLLQGAVDSLIRLEDCHPLLFLSTDIENRVPYPGQNTVLAVYSIVMFLLLNVGLYIFATPSFQSRGIRLSLKSIRSYLVSSWRKSLCWAGSYLFFYLLISVLHTNDSRDPDKLNCPESWQTQSD